MKKIFYATTATAIIISMAACKNDSRIAEEANGMPPSLNAAELAKFQEWKEYQEWKEQKATAKTTAVYTAAPAKPVVKTKIVYVKEPVATTAAKKKGWSKAAKGTAIGAGVGAAAGAIIAKNNRALGAIIGGVAGGGIGYGVGRGMDKKDGRY